MNCNSKMGDCTLFLVKIFRKPSKVRKSCKGSSYITLKVLSNKIKLIFIAIKKELKRTKKDKDELFTVFRDTNWKLMSEYYFGYRSIIDIGTSTQNSSTLICNFQIVLNFSNNIFHLPADSNGSWSQNDLWC